MWVWQHCLSLTARYDCVPSSWADMGEYVGTLALAFAAIMGFWLGLYWLMEWLSG